MIRVLQSPLAAAALAAVLVPAASAQLGFTSHGPIDPNHGFPTNYVDTNGQSLDLCITDPILCGLLAPVTLTNPALPFPNNYGGTFAEENFYNRCVAKMNTNGTSLATLVIALEGAFLNGPVVAGDQMVFSRVRIRAAGLIAGQTYTVTTPVGIYTFVANGNNSINNTDQAGGGFGGDFETALTGHSGPFLRWDTGLPILDAAGREYLGNPALDHTITGSPAGTNFFRIDGPSVGGPGVNRVETNVFQVIGLKTAPILPPAPVAAFNAAPLTGVSPLSVSFSDVSTGTITSWLWDFGDGSLSTLQNPSHLYGVGTYAVSLTVTGPGGSNTLTKPALIGVTAAPPPAPVAQFNAAPLSGTAPLNVAFTDASTGSISSWSWSFGDGGTSTLASPSHSYAAAGLYSVSLTVTGPGGSNSITKPNLIQVNGAPPPAPVAAFNAAPLSGNVPLTVAFTDASTGAISGWSWNFGDGATSTLQSPSHVYSAAGIYSVSLTVSGAGGSNTLLRANLITASNPAPVGLTISNPVPGVAGVANTIVITGCRPNSTVGIISGMVLGANVFNTGRCPGGIPIGIARPNRTLGNARANAAGVATFVTTPPASSAGRIFHFQAVEPSSCSASNIVSEQL